MIEICVNMTINYLIENVIKSNLKPFINLVGNSRQIHSSCVLNKSFKDWYRGLWLPPAGNSPPYNHITQVGDPVLRQPAKDVPEDLITSKEIKFLLDAMKNVLVRHSCCGLAAPQIGIPLRVIIMEFNQKGMDKYSPEIRKARGMELLPYTVFINPQLKVTNFTKNLFPEACASVMGYSADVARYHEIQLTGYNEEGVKKEVIFSGWAARIAQHECDHLDGKLYVDLMDTKTFSCTCWQAVNAREGRVEVAFYPK